MLFNKTTKSTRVKENKSRDSLKLYCCMIKTVTLCIRNIQVQIFKVFIVTFEIFNMKKKKRNMMNEYKFIPVPKALNIAAIMQSGTN